jgi:hypothetical protein
VGAETPLDLPDSEFNLLHPELAGHEVTWKYSQKPYWCEVFKGYTLVLSAGAPIGAGWEELHAKHKVLHVHHEMKVMSLVRACVYTTCQQCMSATWCANGALR